MLSETEETNLMSVIHKLPARFLKQFGSFKEDFFFKDFHTWQLEDVGNAAATAEFSENARILFENYIEYKRAAAEKEEEEKILFVSTIVALILHHR